MTTWKKRLNTFKNKMQKQIEANIPQKGITWQYTQPENFLQNQLYKHYVLGHWVDVANFAFMLWDNEQLKNKAEEKTP